MSLPCNVIEDLLPLYHDGVCSPESAALVEEHLAGCEKCRAALEDYDYQVGETAPVDDMAPLKAIQGRWSREKKRKTAWIAAAVLCLAVVLGMAGNCVWQWLHVNAVHVGTETLRVHDVVYREADDVYPYDFITFTVDQTGGVVEKSSVTYWVTEEGILYLDYYQPSMGAKEDRSFEQTVYFVEEENEEKELTAITDWRSIVRQLEPGMEITEIRVGNEEDYIVVWCR